METFQGDAYCVKCKEKIEFVGYIKVSDSGRRMAQGTCPKCGTKVNRILGLQPGWIVAGSHIAPAVKPEVDKPIIGDDKKAATIIAAQLGDPHDAVSTPAAERVLRMLLEAEPKISQKIIEWNTRREEKKQEKKWKKRFTYELNEYLDNYARTVGLGEYGYTRNIVLDIQQKLREKYANL